MSLAFGCVFEFQPPSRAGAATPLAVHALRSAPCDGFVLQGSNRVSVALRILLRQNGRHRRRAGAGEFARPGFAGDVGTVFFRAPAPSGCGVDDGTTRASKCSDALSFTVLLAPSAPVCRGGSGVSLAYRRPCRVSVLSSPCTHPPHPAFLPRSVCSLARRHARTHSIRFQFTLTARARSWSRCRRRFRVTSVVRPCP